MRIEIILFDGFDEIDAFGPFEVLASAGLDVALTSLPGGDVYSMRGVHLTVPALGQPDAVIVPGGGWLDHAPEGSWAQAQRGVLPARLAELKPRLRWIASVCTGSLLLAAAGLLDGRFATTNRNAYDELRPAVTEVIDARVVDDGDVVTAGGLTAGFDLALWLVERELGTAVADRVSRSIEYPRVGRVWRAPRRAHATGQRFEGLDIVGR